MQILHELYQKILDQGYQYKDKSRDIMMTQISSAQLEFDLTKGFPAVTTKKLYWKGVVGELLWFLRGETNIKYLVDNGINIWNKDAYNYFLKSNFAERSYEGFLKCVKENDSYGNLGRVYGAQWRNWGDSVYWEQYEGLDQISNLIKGLKENPMSRRHIVTAWNPAELDEMALPPCHWSFEVIVEPRVCTANYCYIKDGCHETCCKNEPKYTFTLKWHQRSVDSFLGLPFNIASYALLAHIIGNLTNMIPKALIGDLSNVHIYENHIDAVKEQLTREPYELPELEICSKIDWTKLTIDQVINTRELDDFRLKYYKHHPAIKADMIAPKN